MLYRARFDHPQITDEEKITYWNGRRQCWSFTARLCLSSRDHWSQSAQSSPHQTRI